MAAPKVGVLTVSTRIGARDTAPATLQTHLLDVTPPRLLSATADDPDQDDYVYSAGDTVSIAFDRSTDRGGGAKSGNKAFVDALFAFSEPLAYDCARANAHSCLPALPFGGGGGCSRLCHHRTASALSPCVAVPCAVCLVPCVPCVPVCLVPSPPACADPAAAPNPTESSLLPPPRQPHRQTRCAGRPRPEEKKRETSPTHPS